MIIVVSISKYSDKKQLFKNSIFANSFPIIHNNDNDNKMYVLLENDQVIDYCHIHNECHCGYVYLNKNLVPCSLNENCEMKDIKQIITYERYIRMKKLEIKIKKDKTMIQFLTQLNSIVSSLDMLIVILYVFIMFSKIKTSMIKHYKKLMFLAFILSVIALPLSFICMFIHQTSLAFIWLLNAFLWTLNYRKDKQHMIQEKEKDKHNKNEIK